MVRTFPKLPTVSCFFICNGLRVGRGGVSPNKPPRYAFFMLLVDVGPGICHDIGQRDGPLCGAFTNTAVLKILMTKVSAGHGSQCKEDIRESWSRGWDMLYCEIYISKIYTPVRNRNKTNRVQCTECVSRKIQINNE